MVALVFVFATGKRECEVAPGPSVPHVGGGGDHRQRPERTPKRQPDSLCDVKACGMQTGCGAGRAVTSQFFPGAPVATKRDGAQPLNGMNVVGGRPVCQRLRTWIHTAPRPPIAQSDQMDKGFCPQRCRGLPPPTTALSNSPVGALACWQSHVRLSARHTSPLAFLNAIHAGRPFPRKRNGHQGLGGQVGRTAEGKAARRFWAPPARSAGSSACI